MTDSDITRRRRKVCQYNYYGTCKRQMSCRYWHTKTLLSSPPSDEVCVFFLKTNVCRRGESCHFSHQRPSCRNLSNCTFANCKYTHPSRDEQPATILQPRNDSPNDQVAPESQVRELQGTERVTSDQGTPPSSPIPKMRAVLQLQNRQRTSSHQSTAHPRPRLNRVTRNEAKKPDVGNYECLDGKGLCVAECEFDRKSWHNVHWICAIASVNPDWLRYTPPSKKLKQMCHICGHKDTPWYNKCKSCKEDMTAGRSEAHVREFGRIRLEKEGVKEAKSKYSAFLNCPSYNRTTDSRWAFEKVSMTTASQTSASSSLPRLLSTPSAEQCIAFEEPPKHFEELRSRPLIWACTGNGQNAVFGKHPWKVGILLSFPVNDRHMMLDSTGSNICSTLRKVFDRLAGLPSLDQLFITDVFPFVGHGFFGRPSFGEAEQQEMSTQVLKVLQVRPKLLVLSGEIVRHAVYLTLKGNAKFRVEDLTSELGVPGFVISGVEESDCWSTLVIIQPHPSNDKRRKVFTLAFERRASIIKAVLENTEIPDFQLPPSKNKAESESDCTQVVDDDGDVDGDEDDGDSDVQHHDDVDQEIDRSLRPQVANVNLRTASPPRTPDHPTYVRHGDGKSFHLEGGSGSCNPRSSESKKIVSRAELEKLSPCRRCFSFLSP